LPTRHGDGAQVYQNWRSSSHWHWYDERTTTPSRESSNARTGGHPAAAHLGWGRAPPAPPTLRTTHHPPTIGRTAHEKPQRTRMINTRASWPGRLPKARSSLCRKLTLAEGSHRLLTCLRATRRPTRTVVVTAVRSDMLPRYSTGDSTARTGRSIRRGQRSRTLSLTVGCGRRNVRSAMHESSIVAPESSRRRGVPFPHVRYIVGEINRHRRERG
jgi:hypothetical protein